MFTYEGALTTLDLLSVLVLIGLLVFIAAHAFGQGSVIWVFISEIFPNRIRGTRPVVRLASPTGCSPR